MKKKTFFIVLAVLFIATFVCSCNDISETESYTYKYYKPADEDSVANSLTTSETTSYYEISCSSSEVSYFDENLPEQRYLDGKTFKILTIDEVSRNAYYNCEFASYEVNGDFINDAVAKRTEILKEQYGINLEVIYAKKPSDDLQIQVLAGTDDFQIYSDSLYNCSKSAFMGFFRDTNDFAEIDTENNWWDCNVINDLSLCGHKYFLSGDINISDKNATWCCFFNKNMITEYGFVNPYELVQDGRWTIDKLQEMATAVSSSFDNDNTSSYENHTYGFITQTYDANMGMVACDQKMISKDYNDYPILNLQSERSINTFDKILDLMSDRNTSLIAENIDSNICYDTANSIFIDGRALFQYNSLSYAQELAETDIDFEYGILPLPKFDESQEDYFTSSSVYSSQLVSIPISLPEEDVEDVGYVLNLLAYYGHEIVLPVYCEQISTKQDSVDQEYIEMLDIILYNRTFDLANVYNFGNSNYLYTSILISNTTDFVSTFESYAPQIQAEIDVAIVELDY